MKTYIGTKIIEAEPEKRGEETGFKVSYPDGYVSWSPTQPFEEAYRGNGQLNFGHALEMLKRGHRVARSGWNGKGMWLVLVPGTAKAQLREGTPYREATGLDECEILPHIDMWTINAEGRRAMLPGWLASQSDMLADDWRVLEEGE